MLRVIAPLCALGALVALIASLSGPAAARPLGGHCFQHYVFFDVSSVQLHEKVTAHWSFSTDSGQATADTVQNGTVDFTGHPSKSARGKFQQIAEFIDLTGKCLIPNFRQGRLVVKADGLQSHLTGTWTSGSQSGSCADDLTDAANLKAELIRRSLKISPPPKKLGFRWEVKGVPDLQCKFPVTDPASGETTNAKLGGYTTAVTEPDLDLKRSDLLKKSTIKLPVNLHGGAPKPDNGTATGSVSITGSVTLHRYKSCSITPSTDIRKTRCEFP